MKIKTQNGIWASNSWLLFVITSLLIYPSSALIAQKSYKALFIGNSYTAYNNLPKLVSDVALSAGDTLIYDSNTPGGYQLKDHRVDPTSQNKIANSGWDYVVLQGQSRESITRTSDFNNGAFALNSTIKQTNPCATVLTYMTWGRKNGDPNNCNQFPVMCTYEGMDTTIRNHYLNISSNINSEVSPVSIVWSYLRKNNPGIELYTSDESHPSVAGSYAAACCFYASIFKKDPTLITFNFGLSAADAYAIKKAAKVEVFDKIHLYDFFKNPTAEFIFTKGSQANEFNFMSFNPLSIHQNYFWEFGDGDTSTFRSPSHTYASNGAFTVKLTTTNCKLQGEYTSSQDTIVELCSHSPSVYTSNPWLCNYDTLWTQPADAYQWFTGAKPIVGETKNYLANYKQFNSGVFSVISTVNACSELSKEFFINSTRPQYYFDALGDPCEGDTVNFAVLPFSGSFSGTEVILWYRNGSLLTSMTNKDSLKITQGGSYEVMVVDPMYTCPLDTTTYFVEYECEVVEVNGIENNKQPNVWSFFPNPASESVTINLNGNSTKNQILVYNDKGQLVKMVESSKITVIDISDLPPGVFYIRLKNSIQLAQKFMKQ